MTCFDDPRHQQQTCEWNCADPKKHLHGGCQSVRTHSGHTAYNKRTDRSDDASGVVAETGTGRAKTCGEQFRKIVREGTENAKHGEANKEVAVEPVVWREVQSESQH